MIENIDVFDVNGDGTLIIKTNLDDTYENVRFAWYISYNGLTILKTAYQRNPYMSYRIENLGKYTVKAFVKAETEKYQDEVVFEANKSTSPQLVVETKEVKTVLIPIKENINGPFWRFDINEPLSEEATYAWYIYKENENTPCFKQMYTKYSEYIHSFKEPGNYYAKLFVICNGIKRSAKTDVFTVKDTK